MYKKIEYHKRLYFFVGVFLFFCSLNVLGLSLKILGPNGCLLFSIMVLLCAYFIGKDIIKKIELDEQKLIVTYIFGFNCIYFKDVDSVEEKLRITLVPPRQYKILNFKMNARDDIWYGIHELPEEIKNYLLHKKY